LCRRRADSSTLPANPFPWDGSDTDARFGANYCTSMAVVTLAPECRFLPIYQRGDDSEKKDDKKP
jgi:hypothetical protein